MNYIDEEIKRLENQLIALKKIKDEENLCNKKGNFYIIVSSDEKFSTFNELKQFWESSKCNLCQTDFIYLTYLSNGRYKEFEAHIESNGKINQKEFNELIRIIFTLNSLELFTCVFAICNKKYELRNIATFHSNKLEKEFFRKIMMN